MPHSLSSFFLSSFLTPSILKFPSLNSQSFPLSTVSSHPYQPTMPINLQAHAFAGNPLRTKNLKPETPNSINSALETLKNLILEKTHEGYPPNLKVLPFQKGKPLACTSASAASDSKPIWHLGWISLDDCKGILAKSGIALSENLLVFLGSEEDTAYWAIDVTDVVDGSGLDLGENRFAFIELRTLMVATDWADSSSMGELAIAGHARALLEWHNISRFCGQCGARTMPIDAGKRKQCLNETCKKRTYPRIDPVVIMLVIDKENDRTLLSRQSRFVPRMWSCLAGFIEPGESLEEAVRRETWEETGIEVGEVVYHSSQPWPVGPNSMPCQLMVGFFAYAKSFEIHVDKKELEDAQWHSRDDVKNALTFAEYDKAQRTAAVKVDQMCKGVEKGQNFTTDFSVESGELAPMFIPGPFAIAHHLISSWVNQIAPGCIQLPSNLQH
ncbi:NUDIX hydrolase domain-containing protein [Cinnamomum micranthum f. kanehirae]|uniref:NAD(+) diphosphatase n=1 Tax=Cinnamomum micranthum f. kanehirae TaxID=337451 RepID=A0A3S3MCU8_9MAGN|nr:NUDIX hydrolase domain-containing protein [Cinnamomum micranthum f. kanehirae]